MWMGARTDALKRQDVSGAMNYRLGIDLGSTSLGWAVFRLNDEGLPVALIKAGVRIFHDGREAAKSGGVGAPLAVKRRIARGLRRRRDRMLKRKKRLMNQLIAFGFFPDNKEARKRLETLYPNPYALRAAGVERALKPEEFARALFHLNQRRGFKSNRKLDKEPDAGAGADIVKKSSEESAMKAGISDLRKTLKERQYTAGQLFNERLGQGARVRNRSVLVNKGGKEQLESTYEMSIDRQMVAEEFDAIWKTQAGFNPTLFNDKARDALRDTLLFQRPLKPIRPGRCTLMPEEERAPLALPSSQRFRIYQEVNNLRISDDQMNERSLTLEERDKVVALLEKQGESRFSKLNTLLNLSDTMHFNLDDGKRDRLKGNSVSIALSKPNAFGEAWASFDEHLQDEIVWKLVDEDSEKVLMDWLVATTKVDAERARAIARVRLPEGYGNLSRKALERIVPELRKGVVTYSEAVQAAGFEHHSKLGFDYADSDVETYIDPRTGEPLLNPETGEIQVAFKSLPYYGKPLRRHVAFGTDNPKDPEEVRYGKIANPTVHIGLNQVRQVVNGLIRFYGRPAEVVVELARDLKQSKKDREDEQREQKRNQDRNERISKEIAAILKIDPSEVKKRDIVKWKLWEELSADAADRRCPYSGQQISKSMLLSDQVEIEHILPFSRTLDDSMHNKTVALTKVNRVKANRTPYEAREDFEREGWKYDDILLRVNGFPRHLQRKAKRFAPDGYEQWLGNEKDFIARALNDTRYMSRIAKQYLELVCPRGVRVIPGGVTAKIRHHLGLNDILGEDGLKNRNDHRHHAVDACVIGVTDRSFMQRLATASARAYEQGVDRLISSFAAPWPTYRDHVVRAIDNILVSHKPDHGYQKAMLEDTAHGIRKDGTINPSRSSSKANISFVNPISEPGQERRHGVDADGKPLPYKGYVGGSNYCIEIFKDEKGKWGGEVISTFDAYQVIRKAGSVSKGLQILRDKEKAQNGMPLVMRLMIDDCVKLDADGYTSRTVFRVVKIAATGQVFMAPINEANVAARTAAGADHPLKYTSKYAGSFKKARARKVSITPIGRLSDPGFKE